MSSAPAVKQNFDLAAYNTMGISAHAKYFVSVRTVSGLREVLADPQFRHLSKLMLGGGSNILFIDDYDGLVIHIDIKGVDVSKEDDQEVILKVGAGENWHDLVTQTVHKGWGGLENLSLIPGSVGAAPIQNIGAYGVELEEVFEKLEALEIETGELTVFSKEDCRFGYRDSVFKNELRGQYIITHVFLKLSKDPVLNTSYRALSEKLEEEGIADPTVKDVSEAVIQIRQSKLPDPAEIGNTGSFFKNPVITKDEFEQLQSKYPDIPHYPAGKEIKVPAAWLIDQCGWKGKRFGDAGVHSLQALVIVNYGSATGKEIWELAGKIRNSVQEKFGVSLVPEVNVIG